ncbi:MAG: heavy metal response regulator transcription factor [Candidatus Anammoxibacter sp.]
MKILIVEDEKEMAGYLKQGLEQNSFAVDLAYNGTDGLHLATHEDYDLIILDIMLPEYDGKTILKQVRDMSIRTPVIFLTAKDSVSDKVNGLNMGADDYVVKPFSFSELMARIQACIRRNSGNAYSVLQVKDLTLDPVSRKVFKGKQVIELQPVEFSVLEYLMQNAGRVLTRTTISEHVWDTNFESFSNVVDVHISKLRNKIDKNADKKLIHTVRKVGYVIEERG